MAPAAPAAAAAAAAAAATTPTAAAAAAALVPAEGRVVLLTGQPDLPRMPLSLQFLISNESYRAAAGAARALGRAAMAAGEEPFRSHFEPHFTCHTDTCLAAPAAAAAIAA
jgi:hypothetical protein